MTLVATQTLFTAEDLLNLEDDGLYELVNGRLVDKQMSSLATKTAAIIITKISIFLEKSRGGEIYAEQAFQCFPDDPGLIRRPDIAFITASRLPGVPDEGHVPIAPDLAVEVVSPNDKIYELDAKLAEYRAAGVKQVWVVNPKLRTLRVHGLDHVVTELQESATLDGDPVLPGFSILVRDLLPPGPPAAQHVGP